MHTAGTAVNLARLGRHGTVAGQIYELGGAAEKQCTDLLHSSLKLHCNTSSHCVQEQVASSMGGDELLHSSQVAGEEFTG